MPNETPPAHITLHAMQLVTELAAHLTANRLSAPYWVGMLMDEILTRTDHNMFIAAGFCTEAHSSAWLATQSRETN